MLELAKHKGIAELLVILLYAGAPGAEEYREHRDLLSAYLSETSQNLHMASWYSGIEYIVWALVAGDIESHQFSEYHYPFRLSTIERAELAFLAQKAGGWCTYEGFYTLEDWESDYEAEYESFIRGEKDHK